MGLAALLCLLLVFTLHLNIFNFQRVNVGVSLGFCRISEGFPEVSCKFSWVSAGFPKGFRRVSAHFVRVSMVFAWVSAWFLLSFAGFVQFSSCGRFSKVSAGFLGCSFVWKVLPSLKSKSWRKVITVVVRRCAKSYIFVGTISGARKRWNFATVLISTICPSAFLCFHKFSPGQSKCAKCT